MFALPKIHILSECKSRKNHLTGRYCQKQQITDEGYKGKLPLNDGDCQLNAWDPVKWHQYSDSCSSDGTGKKNSVHEITNIIILILQQTTGAMMAGQFIDIEADKRNY